MNPVKAGETPAMPTDVPPIVGTAIAIPDKDSDYYSVQITVPKIRWLVVGERRPKLEWPTLKVTAESVALELLIFNDPIRIFPVVAAKRECSKPYCESQW